MNVPNAPRGPRRGTPQNATRAACCGVGIERLEARSLMAADSQMAVARMAVGMNLENVVDWSPAWTFTDAFKASRPWIAHAFNTATWGTSWDDASTPPLQLDANGNVVRLVTWTNASGQAMQQRAGTLLFRDLGGGYAGGVYRAEWDGTGIVTFGFDARVITSGTTATGRKFADLQVTPSDNGIYLAIESTSPADPARNFNVWMPDWEGRRFAGQRWEPGAAFSPFHPLFLQRLAPFHTLRFMGMQETNSSDIRGWGDRRDAADVRQGSGPGGTASQPIVNGISVEYMVQLANDLDADPWFNMPHLADDTFVRKFATYVRDHLEPGRKVHVEWANEVWNFGWGFEPSQWIAEQTKLPANAGLDPDLAHWQIAGREAKRDLDIWSDVFAGRTDRLVRVAAGWAAVDWVTGQIAEAIEASYRQLLNRTPLASERLGDAESQLRNGVLTVADFIAQIALSDMFQVRLQRMAPLRSASAAYLSLLGRAAQPAEVSRFLARRANAGQRAALEDLLASKEYASSFGRDTVPYLRGLGTLDGQPLSTVNRTAQLYGGNAALNPPIREVL